MQNKQFGSDFFWGVAISAIQNEGAHLTDGKGLSNWDVFARKTGKIKGGAKPYNACEFYYRYKQDLLLAKALGFNVFRFSISWSRILPEGTGKINAAGVEFYNKLIEECLQLQLIPFVTLYHWDLPYTLEKEGGWSSHLINKWFNRFVTVCAEQFGDRVKNWIVLNEPVGFTSLGYILGKHAPGKIDMASFLSSVHHAAIAQADGGRILRQNVSNAYIGTSFSCSEVMPFTNKEVDIQAANKLDIILNRLFIEPAIGRNFPYQDGFEFLERLHLHNKTWKHTDRYSFNFDFIGIQNYFAITVKHNPIIPYIHASEVPARKRGVPYTDFGWEINPQSFYKMLKRFWMYGSVKEIIISEGGAFFKDELKNGIINDEKRINYFEQYLQAALKAKQEGVNLKGYFAWTLTDNFEWAEGYNAKFGLIHVDFATQQRTIKNSGFWWRSFLQS
jgi:beta-glucosidase